MTISLKTVLDERNIKQKELAELTGMTESSLSRKMRNTRNWKAPDISKVMKALNLTADEVVHIFL